MATFQYGTTTINYQVVRSNRKTVGLEVSIEDGVKIRAPKRLSQAEIESIVEKKAEWILKKQNKLSDVKPAPNPKEFLSGEKLPYLGRRYRIKLQESDNVKQVKVKLYQGKFWLMISKSVAEADDRRELIREEVIQWYRSHADAKIKERVKKYQQQIGEEPNAIKVKKQKKRWGSCSSKRNLNFNWKLIMAPMSVIDYLVVHELAHLKYPNHSKEFWQLVEAVIPNYEEKQEWLRINGRRLDI
ncbi:M48 family metallopeptidase [Halanaerobacter jeridensis]|uniref:Metal-dependent hydrolase n=1 Tax=Halanaerobacter jeridensis TaxID=706427 RepID=A0A938XTT6_9FIRM|nr:SprT family zinc-dependent metalloprotease [Halanaerobacter jeridensis]MBM7556774.1 putative metal-dependent hydrolase [Halanaerobacter jeridensis]